MLILVAVSINVLIKSDLIGATKTAADRWQNETDKEKEIGSKIVIDGVEYDSIEDYVNNRPSTGGNEGEHNWTRTGDVITCSHCAETYTIGDPYEYTCGGTGTSTILGTESGMAAYIEDESDVPENTVNSETGDQNVSRDSNTTWVVLGIADSKTLLITTSKPTDDYYYLYGEYAYNNGIEILNKVCQDLYGENARGITMADLDRCFNYEPEGGGYYAGGPMCTGNFTTRIDSLSTWNNIKSNGTNTPDGENTEAELGSYLITCYYYMVESTKDTKLKLSDGRKTGSITENEINVIFGKDLDYWYWLASLGVYADSWATFGPGYIDCGEADSGDFLYWSDGRRHCSRFPVRPVVSII